MATDPVPPVVPRSDVLGTLRRERWFAADAGETERVTQIDAQIARLSARNSAKAPTREAAAARPAANPTTARPQARKGDRRVPPAR